MLYCQNAGRGVRVGFRITNDGRKERYCKVTGVSLGFVGPAKATRAGKAPATTAAPAPASTARRFNLMTVRSILDLPFTRRGAMNKFCEEIKSLASCSMCFARRSSPRRGGIGGRGADGRYR
jgi:hypothetical protein